MKNGSNSNSHLIEESWLSEFEKYSGILGSHLNILVE